MVEMLLDGVFWRMSRFLRVSDRHQVQSAQFFFRVSFFGWTVDRTRVTARLLGLNGDSNGGNVRHRSIFRDFVSRCSVFLMVYFDVRLLIFAFAIICFFAIFCRYILGEFERIIRHFEAVTRVDCYLVSVYKGIFVDICQF